MNLLDDMELTNAELALLLERLEAVHGNKAARLREKLTFLLDRTLDVLDTKEKVWAAYADRELSEDEAKERLAELEITP